MFRYIALVWNVTNGERVETYALPVLTYTLPRAARDALLWRRDTLPTAKARAEERYQWDKITDQYEALLDDARRGRNEMAASSF